MFYNEKDNEWLVNIGAGFQMVVRDCALTALYNTIDLNNQNEDTFGLAPHATFTLSEPQFPCCGENCSNKKCKIEEGYSAGLLSVLYPNPGYGCAKNTPKYSELPSAHFFDNNDNIDKQIPSRCQKDLNICVVGQQWPGAPLPQQYSTGCFATQMKGMPGRSICIT